MSLYIGNISSSIRRDDLERVFQRFGRCDVRIKDGYGFVVYDFPPNAEKALKALQRRHICGESLTLTWSNKQPRQFNRLARSGRSYDPQHDRDSVRRGGYVKGKLGSNDQDYRKNIKQSDGINRRNGSDDMHDKEVMYCEHDAKDSLGEDRFEPDKVDNDRWQERLFHDQSTENGVEYERYEPHQSYDMKYDDGIHKMAYRCGSPVLPSHQKDIGRANCDEVNLESPCNAKFQVTCYRCGGSGHKMRNCPQESTLRRKYTRFDHRHVEDVNRRGRDGSELRRDGSRSWEKSSRDSISKRLKNDVNSSALGKHQKPISNGSSPVGNETDKSSNKHYGGNKRSRKEIGSPNRHGTKKARRSFSSSRHSRFHSSSQSSEPMKRSHHLSRSRSISLEAHSLSSKSRSSSTARFSQSKSSKSQARSSSRTSLSTSLGRPLPSSSNKVQINMKGSSDNATTPESKAIVIEQVQLAVSDNGLEDAKAENRLVAVNHENGVPPFTAEFEMGKGQPLEKDNEDHQIASWSLHEGTNPSTLAVEQGAVDDEGLSLKNHESGRLSPTGIMEMNCQISDKLTTEDVPVQMKNPGSEPPVSSGSGHSLSISAEELHVVVKHYYGHELQNENEKCLPAEAYFGSARLWPWEVIYYRRSKKGPISIENYAKRLDQNKEFNIVDKYIRSSSGWGELAQKNL